MDLNDEGQTVSYEEPEKTPAIGTEARDKDSGNNEGLARENAVIIDTVEYKNIKPGKEYKMVGILMDKETKKPFLDKDGKSITSSLVFKPEKEDESVELEFVFNAKDLGGKSVVVFEKLFFEDKEIANHEDIEDAGQTVTYTEPKKPDEPEKPDIPTTPKTGDDSVSLALLVFLSFMLGVLLGVVRYTAIRRRDLEELMQDVKENALFYRKIRTDSERVLSLYTCGRGNSRVAVFCVEKERVDISNQ